MVCMYLYRCVCVSICPYVVGVPGGDVVGRSGAQKTQGQQVADRRDRGGHAHEAHTVRRHAQLLVHGQYDTLMHILYGICMHVW